MPNVAWNQSILYQAPDGKCVVVLPPLSTFFSCSLLADPTSGETSFGSLDALGGKAVCNSSNDTVPEPLRFGLWCETSGLQPAMYIT